MIAPLKTARRWLIRLLEDTEDDLGPDSGIVPVPEPDTRKPVGTVKETLKELRDNHLYHQALAINALHIRIGRVEAKLGLQLALQLAIFGTVFGAVFKVFLEEAIRSFISGMF